MKIFSTLNPVNVNTVKIRTSFVKMQVDAFGALQRFRKNSAGIAALEFALLAPVLFGIYFGVAVISLAISADRNVSHATSVIGDLASQEISLTPDMIDNIFTAGTAVIGVGQDKYNDQRITLELISYRKTNGALQQIGYARLGPSIGNYNNSALASNDQLVGNDSGMVVARIAYKYQMPLGNFANYTLAETFMLKPRKSSYVPFGATSGGTGGSFTGCNVSGGLVVSGC